MILRKFFFMIFLSLFSVFAFSDEYLDSQVLEFVQKITNGLSESKKYSIGIMNFDATDELFMEYFESQFFETLFNLNKYKITDPENVKILLTEQKFQLSGNVDDETAKSIGKLIGVDLLCYGKITKLGSEIRISGKIVNVESGEVVGIANQNINVDNISKNIMSVSDLNTIDNKTEWIIQKKYSKDYNTYEYFLLNHSLTDYNVYLVLEYVKETDKNKSKVIITLHDDQKLKDSLGWYIDISKIDYRFDKEAIISEKWDGYEGKNGSFAKIATPANPKDFINNIMLYSIIEMHFKFDVKDQYVKFDISDISTALNKQKLSISELLDCFPDFFKN